MSNLCNVDEDGTVSAGTLDEEQLESLRQTLPFRELVENEDDHGRLHGVMYPENVQRARLSVCKRPRMVAGGEKIFTGLSERCTHFPCLSIFLFLNLCLLILLPDDC